MFQKARQSTKQYHAELYQKDILYKKGTWLEKPEKDILEIGEKLQDKNNIRILDLGSGIGRNAIPLVQMLQKNKVMIECVDYLEIAIKKLNEYAQKFRVKKHINGHILPVEDFTIKQNSYDFIISHGVLAHVKNKNTLLRVLRDIRNGVKKEGYVYLAIASGLKEKETDTQKKLIPLVEVSLETKELINIYKKIFSDWKIEIIRTDPYIEYYEKDGKKIEWSCNFVVFVGRKN